MDNDDIFSAFGVDDEIAPLPPPPPTKPVAVVAAVPAITVAEAKPLDRFKDVTFPSRRNEAPFSLQKLAREHTEEAFGTVLEIMRDKNTDASTRLEAAKQVLDRGWGKATVQIKAEHARVDLNQLTSQLLEHKSEVDELMAEAMRIESEQFGQYITVDAVVSEESPSRSE